VRFRQSYQGCELAVLLLGERHDARIGSCPKILTILKHALDAGAIREGYGHTGHAVPVSPDIAQPHANTSVDAVSLPLSVTSLGEVISAKAECNFTGANAAK